MAVVLDDWVTIKKPGDDEGLDDGIEEEKGPGPKLEWSY
jgi:hypothetical protein